MMKTLCTVLFLAALTFGAAAADVSYATEAAISPGKGKDQYQVEVRISRVTEQAGRTVETVIASPRVLANLGQPATLFTGSEDSKGESVAVEVFCPVKSANDFASCTVTIKRGGQTLSKSAMKLKLAAP
jgi:hypothetical protein